jgi:hypothetical protein
LEDAAYLAAHLRLSEKWDAFHACGCHIVVANGKSYMLEPIVIAKGMSIPMFVVFDADGDAKKPDQRARHEKDNRAIMKVIDLTADPFPTADIIGVNHAVWVMRMRESIRAENQARFDALTEEIRIQYAHEGGLDKSSVFVADVLERGWHDGFRSRVLESLCDAILEFAMRERQW